MPQLNDYEFDITRELFSIALANAADAFSKMANEKVLLQGFEANFLETEEFSVILEDLPSEKIYVLSTEIKGKIKGRTYLIFHQQDVKTIFKIFAPAPVHETAPDGTLTDIQQDILLELDNIISAAMVTQLSNFLDLFIYGDIPKYKHLLKTDVLELFLKDVKSFHNVLHIKTKLQSFHTNMTPVFVCLFEDEFIKTTKNMITDKKEKILMKIKRSE